MWLWLGLGLGFGRLHVRVVRRVEEQLQLALLEARAEGAHELGDEGALRARAADGDEQAHGLARRRTRDARLAGVGARVGVGTRVGPGEVAMRAWQSASRLMTRSLGIQPPARRSCEGGTPMRSRRW